MDNEKHISITVRAPPGKRPGDYMGVFHPRSGKLFRVQIPKTWRSGKPLTVNFQAPLKSQEKIEPATLPDEELHPRVIENALSNILIIIDGRPSLPVLLNIQRSCCLVVTRM